MLGSTNKRVSSGFMTPVDDTSETQQHGGSISATYISILNGIPRDKSDFDI